MANNFSDAWQEFTLWYSVVIFTERLHWWVTDPVTSGWTAQLCRSVPLSHSTPSSPLASQAVLPMVKNQSTSERSHKADGLQRELQTREREMGNRVVKEESCERPLSPETRKLERSGKVQKCIEKICSFPPFVCLCLDTLPLWWHCPWPHWLFESLEKETPFKKGS